MRNRNLSRVVSALLLIAMLIGIIPIGIEKSYANSKEMLYRTYPTDVIYIGGSGDDIINEVIETSDGGSLIIGYSNSTDAGFKNNGLEDGIIIKLDTNGNQEWISSYGSEKSDKFYRGMEIDDGYLITSKINNRYVLLKFSKNGDLEKEVLNENIIAMTKNNDTYFFANTNNEILITDFNFNIKNIVSIDKENLSYKMDNNDEIYDMHFNNGYLYLIICHHYYSSYSFILVESKYENNALKYPKSQEIRYSNTWKEVDLKKRNKYTSCDLENFKIFKEIFFNSKTNYPYPNPNPRNLNTLDNGNRIYGGTNFLVEVSDEDVVLGAAFNVIPEGFKTSNTDTGDLEIYFAKQNSNKDTLIAIGYGKTIEYKEKALGGKDIIIAKFKYSNSNKDLIKFFHETDYENLRTHSTYPDGLYDYPYNGYHFASNGDNLMYISRIIDGKISVEKHTWQNNKDRKDWDIDIEHYADGKQTIIEQAVLPDGSLVIIGTTCSSFFLGNRAINKESNELFVLKISKDGEIIWGSRGSGNYLWVWTKSGVHGGYFDKIDVKSYIDENYVYVYNTHEKYMSCKKINLETGEMENCSSSYDSSVARYGSYPYKIAFTSVFAFDNEGKIKGYFYKSPNPKETVAYAGEYFSVKNIEASRYNGYSSYKDVLVSTKTDLLSNEIKKDDKTAPIITIAPYNTEWTNKDIVVTATVDKGTLNATSHTFTENGSFTFTAKDEAGNIAEPVTIKITNIDKVAPTVTITNKDGKITVEAKDNDGGSGIDKKFFKLDSNDWVNEMPNLTLLKDGKHTIQAKATDLAGNESKVETLDFYTADEAIKAGEDALKALEKAEKTKTEQDVNTAQNLINIAKTKAEALDNENPSKATLLENVKTMQDRLDNIKNNNEQEKALEEAIKAVEKAEETITQTDVDYARSLVNKLPNGKDKKDLNARLDKVQAEIDKQLALEEAIKAVEKAEETIEQADVDFARNLVSKLPNGKDKKDLNARLDKVQAEIDKQLALEKATKAVEKAEQTKTQIDVDSARSLVNKLPDGQDKDDLSDRLDIMEQQFALEKATRAVEKAEETITQTDVDYAKSLVNKLPNGKDKKDLNARLDKVQAKIDKQLALEKATRAVEKAEETIKQTDVDYARGLVNKLPDGQGKDDLNDRLDIIQAEIDKEKEQQEKALTEATRAVEKAEETKTQTDVDYARGLVSKLPNSKDKKDLNARLDKVQAEIDERLALEEAIKAVEKAEKTETQADVNAAYSKVNKLPNSQEKIALINRLKAVEKKIAEKLAKEKAEIEAIRAVEIAELYKREPYIQKAKDKVMLLEDGELKTTLEERLAKLELESPQNKAKINEAEKLVELVENYKRYDLKSKARQYVPKAQEAIDKLDPSEKKIELQERLDICKEELNDGKQLSDEERKVKKEIDNATMFVELYETYGYTMYYRKAEQLVNALPEGEEKTALMERLGLQVIENVNRAMMLTFNVKTLEDTKITKSVDKTLEIATKYVEEAEKSNLETVIKIALEKVNKLPASQEKETLLNRLEVLK